MSSYSAPTRTLPDKPSSLSFASRRKNCSVVSRRRRRPPSTKRDDSNGLRSCEFRSGRPAASACASLRLFQLGKLKQHVDGVNIETFCAAVDAGDVATVRRLAKARPELVSIRAGRRIPEMIALHFALLIGRGKTRALMALGSDARKGVWPHRDAIAALHHRQGA